MRDSSDSISSRHRYVQGGCKYRLLQDLVIPAGAVFDPGPIETSFSEVPIEYSLGLGPNHTGFVIIPCDRIENLPDWFEAIE